jgi:hypothetical protein
MRQKSTTPKRIERKKIDGMELSPAFYKEYKSLKTDRERRAWKSRYEDKTSPPFDEIYDANGNFIRSIHSTPKKSKK